MRNLTLAANATMDADRIKDSDMFSASSLAGEAEGVQGDRKFVVALARGLEVLRTFRPRDGFLGNQEIAERTGLPKPTVTRLTHTLCTLGYLIRMPRTGKYQLSPTAITLGYSALANLGIRQIARRFMDEMAETVAAPVALGVMDRDRALYVDISRGSSAFTIQLDIGSRIPLATTAMGRALIAGLPAAEREAIMERLSAHYKEAWSPMRKNLEAALEAFGRDGYVISIGSWRTGINAVGVPLVAADGSGIYAFNCGGPPYQFTESFLRDVAGPAIVTLKRSVQNIVEGSASSRDIS